jgi:hypothetical protein
VASRLGLRRAQPSLFNGLTWKLSRKYPASIRHPAAARQVNTSDLSGVILGPPSRKSDPLQSVDRPRRCVIRARNSSRSCSGIANSKTALSHLPPVTSMNDPVVKEASDADRAAACACESGRRRADSAASASDKNCLSHR